MPSLGRISKPNSQAEFPEREDRRDTYFPGRGKVYRRSANSEEWDRRSPREEEGVSCRTTSHNTYYVKLESYT